MIGPQHVGAIAAFSMTFTSSECNHLDFQGFNSVLLKTFAAHALPPQTRKCPSTW